MEPLILTFDMIERLARFAGWFCTEVQTDLYDFTNTKGIIMAQASHSLSEVNIIYPYGLVCLIEQVRKSRYLLFDSMMALYLYLEDPNISTSFPTLYGIKLAQGLKGYYEPSQV